MDTCSIVNLHNGGALEQAFAVERHNYFVGPEVLSECDGRCKPLLDAIQAGKVTVLDDSGVPAALFVNLSQIHRLGNGETECLVYAQLDLNRIICSDDGAARTVATTLYGQHRIVGSIRLLLHCVQDGILTEDEAFASYLQMRHRGGFLPLLAMEAFLAA
jgi:predicted nucleic acid-binding protein